jgi:D-glycero-D-manno-heptose 1,7-bisphosphate phosphatase
MSAAGRPGIVLDRDGTLIDVVRDEETGTTSVAFHPAQLRLLPGVITGLQALSQAGFVLAIASNQPGPAKGQFSRAAVERTNLALVALLAQAGISIAALEVCMHHPHGGPGGDPTLAVECTCRKPKPGLLLSLIAGLGLEPEQSWMIGDSRADLEAAQAASLRSALVFSTARCELCPLRGGPPGKPTLVAPHFDEVARLILAAHATRG